MPPLCDCSLEHFLYVYFIYLFLLLLFVLFVCLFCFLGFKKKLVRCFVITSLSAYSGHFSCFKQTFSLLENATFGQI